MSTLCLFFFQNSKWLFNSGDVISQKKRIIFFQWSLKYFYRLISSLLPALPIKTHDFRCAFFFKKLFLKAHLYGFQGLFCIYHDFFKGLALGSVFLLWCLRYIMPIAFLTNHFTFSICIGDFEVYARVKCFFTCIPSRTRIHLNAIFILSCIADVCMW